MGKCGKLSKAVYVAVMVPPSGSFTCNPSAVGLLSMQSLLICKKCPVVPESAIASIFCCTADAYVAIFCFGGDGV